MTRAIRRLCRPAIPLFLVAALVATGSPFARAQATSPTPSRDPSGDTAAVAVNTQDGANLFAFAFEVKKTMQDVVDNQNVAIAVSSCTECRTVAVAFQIVLVMGDPTVVVPQNLAVALNVDCTSCETMASAYQFVVSTSGPVRLTREGRRALARLLRDVLPRLTDERWLAEAPLSEIGALFDEMARRLADILTNHLEPARLDDDDEGDDADDEGSATDEDDEDGGGSGTSPSPTASPSTSPSPSPSASPTASPTPTATASPSAA